MDCFYHWLLVDTDASNNLVTYYNYRHMPGYIRISNCEISQCRETRRSRITRIPLMAADVYVLLTQMSNIAYTSNKKKWTTGTLPRVGRLEKRRNGLKSLPFPPWAICIGFFKHLRSAWLPASCVQRGSSHFRSDWRMVLIKQLLRRVIHKYTIYKVREKASCGSFHQVRFSKTFESLVGELQLDNE